MCQNFFVTNKNFQKTIFLVERSQCSDDPNLNSFATENVQKWCLVGHGPGWRGQTPSGGDLTFVLPVHLGVWQCSTSRVPAGRLAQMVDFAQWRHLTAAQLQ